MGSKVWAALFVFFLVASVSPQDDTADNSEPQIDSQPESQQSESQPSDSESQQSDAEGDEGAASENSQSENGDIESGSVSGRVSVSLRGSIGNDINGVIDSGFSRVQGSLGSLLSRIPKEVKIGVGGFTIRVVDLNASAVVSRSSQTISVTGVLKIKAGPLKIPDLDVLGTVNGDRDASFVISKTTLPILPGVTIDNIALEAWKRGGDLGLTFQASATFDSIKNFMAYLFQQFPIGGNSVAKFLRSFSLNGDTTIALTTKAGEEMIRSLQSKKDLIRGITLFIRMSTDSKATNFLKKWFRLDSMELSVAVPIPFSMQDPVQIAGTVVFTGLEFKVFRFEQLQLSVAKITSMPTFTASITFAIKLPEIRSKGLGWSEWLRFALAGSIDPAGVTIGGGLISTWKKPFGIPGLEIEYATLEVSLGTGPLGLRGAGLAFSITISDQTKLQAAGKIDIANPSNCWVKAYISRLSLRSIINFGSRIIAAASKNKNSGSVRTLSAVSKLLPPAELNEFELSLSTLSGAQTIGGKSIHVDAGIAVRGDLRMIGSSCKFASRTRTTEFLGIPVPDQEFMIEFETRIFSQITQVYLSFLGKLGIPKAIRNKLDVLGDIAFSLQKFSIIDSLINGNPIKFGLRFTIFRKKFSISIPCPLTVLFGKIRTIISKVNWKKIILDLVKAIFGKPLKLLINAAKAVGKIVSKAAKKVVGGLKKLGGKIKGGLKKVGGKISRAGRVVSMGVSRAGRAISRGASKAGRAVARAAKSITRSVGRSVSKAASKVKKFFRRLWR